MELNEDDNIELAFCHNDLGNYSQTPKLKEHAQKCNNNFNRAKVKNVEIMEKNDINI